MIINDWVADRRFVPSLPLVACLACVIGVLFSAVAVSPYLSPRFPNCFPCVSLHVSPLLRIDDWICGVTRKEVLL